MSILKQWWEYYNSSNLLPERAKAFFSKFKTQEQYVVAKTRQRGK